MHEVALSQSIVDAVTECARREGMRRVTRIVLDIGVAAAVLPESLTFCFDLVAAGTAAAGAELVIDRVALRAACVACGTEFAPPDLRSECPACGRHGLRVTAGRELRLKAIEGE